MWMAAAGERHSLSAIAALSVSIRPLRGDLPGGPCALEIYLDPGRVSGSGTIVALDDNPDPKYVFALRQFDASLACSGLRSMRAETWFGSGGGPAAYSKKARALFLPHQRSRQDGALTSTEFQPVSHRFWLTVADLTGRVILGSSANQDSCMATSSGWRFMTSIFPHPRS